MSSRPLRYRANILEHQQPCFHLWFVEHFAEPTAWFEARTTFARFVLCMCSSPSYCPLIGESWRQTYENLSQIIVVVEHCYFSTGRALMVSCILHAPNLLVGRCPLEQKLRSAVPHTYAQGCVKRRYILLGTSFKPRKWVSSRFFFKRERNLSKYN